MEKFRNILKKNRKKWYKNEQVRGEKRLQKKVIILPS